VFTVAENLPGESLKMMELELAEATLGEEQLVAK
jgi:hypothetical protein